MIKINLLPEELRVEDYTSPSKIISIVVSILIVLFSGILFIYYHFFKIAEYREKVTKAHILRESLRKYEKENDKIKKLLKSFSNISQTIEEVKAQRVPLSKKLYELAEIVGKFPIWIENLSIKRKKVKKSRGRRRRRRKGAQIQYPQFFWKGSYVCVSKTINRATEFYKAIKNDPNFFKDFIEISVPQFSQTSFGKEYGNKIGWRFNLEMTMQIQEKTQSKKK